MVRALSPETLTEPLLDRLLGPIEVQAKCINGMATAYGMPEVEPNEPIEEKLMGASYDPSSRVRATNLRVVPESNEVVADFEVMSDGTDNDYVGSVFGEPVADARLDLFKVQVKTGYLPVVEAETTKERLTGANYQPSEGVLIRNMRVIPKSDVKDVLLGRVFRADYDAGLLETPEVVTRVGILAAQVLAGDLPEVEVYFRKPEPRTNVVIPF